MPKMPKARQSEFSSRVTLYEPPAAAPADASTSAAVNADVAAPAAPEAIPPPSALQGHGRPLDSPQRRSTRASRAAAIASKSGSDSDAAFEELVKLEDEDSKKPAKPKSPRKPKAFVEKLDKAHPAPPRWKETYEIIRKQRESIVAPVDYAGCEQGGRERDEAPVSEKERRLSTIVSLMLSSQTKDPVTHQATANLRNDLPGGLTLEALLNASIEQIDACICKVGFHNTKAKNLKLLAERLRDLHDGDVPSDLPSLLDIVGVGPKMALLYLQAIGINAGIGVDVHVHRITNRLGWHKPQTNTAEQTRLNLESWLPKDLHPHINLMLVGFGQVICKPVGPRCDLCDVAKAGTGRLCPSKRVVTPAKKRKRDVKDEDEDEPASPSSSSRRADTGSGLPKVEIKVEDEAHVAVDMKQDGQLARLEGDEARAIAHAIEEHKPDVSP